MPQLQSKIFNEFTKQVQQRTSSYDALYQAFSGGKKSPKIEILKQAVKNQYQKQKENFNNRFSEETQGALKESAAFVGGVAALGTARHYYLKNPETFNEENIQNKTDNLIDATIPSKFLKKSVRQAHKDIGDELEKIVKFQSNISSARFVTSKLSPAFSIVPQLANPAFVTTSVLSGGDAIVISRLLRIKKMLEIRPDIIPHDKKEEYAQKICSIQKHIPREIAFDLLKIFYRGQIVTVNRKLRENQKPETNYKNSIFREAAKKRLIPLKNNLPIISWILPTSYLISDLAAKDTRALKEDLEDFNNFFKDIHHADTDNNTQKASLPKKCLPVICDNPKNKIKKAREKAHAHAQKIIAMQEDFKLKKEQFEIQIKKEEQMLNEHKANQKSDS